MGEAAWAGCGSGPLWALCPNMEGFLSPFESRRPRPKRSAFQILQAGRAVPSTGWPAPTHLSFLCLLLISAPLQPLGPEFSLSTGSPAPISTALQHRKERPWTHDRRKHSFPLPAHHLLSLPKDPSYSNEPFNYYSLSNCYVLVPGARTVNCESSGLPMSKAESTLSSLVPTLGMAPPHTRQS